MLVLLSFMAYFLHFYVDVDGCVMVILIGGSIPQFGSIVPP